MNPIILMAAAGLGAFLIFGKKKEGSGSSTSSSGGTRPPRPIPPIPPIEDEDVILPEPEVEPGSLGASYASLWESFPYEAAWYPAKGDKNRIPPPSTWDGISMTSDCRMIAIGQGWWERVGFFAQSLIDKGETDAGHIANAIVAHYLSRCGGAMTEAVAALQADIVDRLKEALGPGSSSGGSGGGKTFGSAAVKNGLARASSMGVPLARLRSPFDFGVRNCPPSRTTLPQPYVPAGVEFSTPHRNAITQEPLKFGVAPGLVLDPMKSVNVSAAWSRRRIGPTDGTDARPNGVPQGGPRPWRNRGLLSVLARNPKRRAIRKR